jgi:hypothetical protein
MFIEKSRFLASLGMTEKGTMLGVPNSEQLSAFSHQLSALAEADTRKQGTDCGGRDRKESVYASFSCLLRITLPRPISDRIPSIANLHNTTRLNSQIIELIVDS